MPTKVPRYQHSPVTHFCPSTAPHTLGCRSSQPYHDQSLLLSTHSGRAVLLCRAMSGFEIAGVVLGSIPLVISALEHYMDGVNTIQSFRSYKRVLRRLILTLQTEHVGLQNVCEKLLVGIAPQTCIEEMIDDPFGELWRENEVFNKLRLRLWRSFKVFDETVRDMREAIQEMMDKLNLGPNGKVSANLYQTGVPMLMIECTRSCGQRAHPSSGS